jgi:hypothetical protein
MSFSIARRLHSVVRLWQKIHVQQESRWCKDAKSFSGNWTVLFEAIIARIVQG